jgi:hypothetical protein
MTQKSGKISNQEEKVAKFVTNFQDLYLQKADFWEILSKKVWHGVCNISE